ncbi:uncharacterized protein LOC132553403 [Ylistrum balloti]|uniref:uncharacterized protein LOC132553403 n=1 Tax=Ylistrum balloti TaxID=509963 RepID=UPI002905B2F5|nr:uncharacterized protein LOC132553403 [Ylistrum balloti]
MSVRWYVLCCCRITDENDDNYSPPYVNYQPFTNEPLDHHNRKDTETIELSTLRHENHGLKSSHRQKDGRTNKEDGLTWRDEDLCFKHRRVVYCRRSSLSMTNLFDPLQVDKDEDIDDCLSAAQKRCTFPPFRRKNGMKMFVGYTSQQSYRKLESDTDSSSKDSLSVSSSCETESNSSTTDKEQEVMSRKVPEQSIDRNCHANKGHMHVSAIIPDIELQKLATNCPLCKGMPRLYLVSKFHS